MTPTSSTDASVNTGDDLGVPASLSNTDRIYLRCARLMLDGHCVMSPNLTSFDLTFRGGLGGNEAGIKDLLDGPGGAIAITTEPWTLTIDGQAVDLPATRMWHPRMRLEDRASVAASVRAGRETDARLTPMDDTTFRMFMPERLRHPEQQLAPAAWDLVGIEQTLPQTGVAG